LLPQKTNNLYKRAVAAITQRIATHYSELGNSNTCFNKSLDTNHCYIPQKENFSDYQLINFYTVPEPVQNPKPLAWETLVYGNMELVMQSEDILDTSPNAGVNIDSTQTTQFIDQLPGVSVGHSTTPDDYLMDDSITSADLSNFLARPVRIADITWSDAASPGLLSSFDPWNLFFSDSRIKYKLNNYAFIRCDLKVKVVINATPFYYGSALVSYQPLPVFTPSTIVNDAATRYFIPYSQRPHMWISPQHSEGGEMTLPFFWPKNWLRVSVAADFTNMGKMHIHNFTQLISANGAGSGSISVQVYAWAENVTLSGPTLNLSMQSVDEYDSPGPISGPASTVARYASLLTGIPLIGRFATATEMGANAVSGIAKLFGYTNVPNLRPATSVRPSPMPRLASPEIGYPVESLTIDSKNELSIDPQIVGLPAEDELSIEYICKKQSYLCSSTWNISTLVDTPLFTSRITPFMFDREASTIAKIYFTPMAYVAALFRHWRGDIIFTFKFVASPFHKGRVRISYDPVSTSIQTVGDTGSGVFNTIVDLGADTEVDVRVPYQQALAWLQVNNSFGASNIPWSTSTTPAISIDDTVDNGIISVKTLTRLTAPVTVAPVTLMVFVRAAENLEFANPMTPTQFSSLWTPQSSEEFEGVEAHIGNTPSLKMERYRVNMGETVRSLRPLLRRSNYCETISQPAAASGVGFIYNRHFRFPLYYGFDPQGIHQAKGLINTLTTYPFNWVKPIPYHWIAPAFIAQRGSAMWHYNAETPVACTHMSANRLPTFEYSGGTVSSVSTTATTNSLVANFYKSQFYPTEGGTAVTNQLTNGCLSVSYPNMSQYKFQSTRPSSTSNPGTNDGIEDGTNFEAVAFCCNYGTTSGPLPAAIRVHKYFGVGVDYNLHFFLNAPTLYNSVSDPVAV